MTFFVTTVSGWESLDIVTKKSILVAKHDLDPFLLQTEVNG